jgi:hypothetical protein
VQLGPVPVRRTGGVVAGMKFNKEFWDLKQQNVIKLVQWNITALEAVTEEVHVSMMGYFHVH